jgi:hypothetical protein
MSEPVPSLEAQLRGAELENKMLRARVEALGPGRSKKWEERYFQQAGRSHELEKLLIKYIAGVIDHESVDYLDYLEWNKDIPTTSEEIAKIRSYVPAARKLLGLEPQEQG